MNYVLKNQIRRFFIVAGRRREAAEITETNRDKRAPLEWE